MHPALQLRSSNRSLFTRTPSRDLGSRWCLGRPYSNLAVYLGHALRDLDNIGIGAESVNVKKEHRLRGSSSRGASLEGSTGPQNILRYPLTQAVEAHPGGQHRARETVEVFGTSSCL